MPVVRFTVCTILGSLVWNTALIGAGGVLGNRWREVGDVVGLLQAVIVVLILLSLGRLAWKRVLEPRLRSAGHPPPGDA